MAVQQRAEGQVAGIAEKVSRAISRYGGPESGRRRTLIALAIRGATNQFIRSLGPGTLKRDGLSDLFSHMGYGEAVEGHDRTALWGAIAIAQAETMHWLSDAVALLQLPASYTHEISSRARAFTRTLLAEIDTGYQHGLVEVAPERLCQALIDGGEVQPFAAHLGWTPPTEVVVINGRSRGPTKWPRPESTPIMASPTMATYVIPSSEADALIGMLRDMPGIRIAVSWPVPTDRIQDADRWTNTALDLAGRRIIPRRQVIYCAHHRVDLWGAADNALRADMAEAVLQPLLDAPPGSRSALSETLLLWLQTHGSAPQLGDRLGVHPQTVRYRWRRVTELFGDNLADPESATELLLALRASLPLWRADPKSACRRKRPRGTC